MAPAAHGQEAGTTGQSGVLTGTVVNGSHNNQPVGGQAVTLQAYVSHATLQNIAHVTSDARGGFTFTGLDGSGATTYVVSVPYQGGLFSSNAITLNNGSASETLSVYDTTTDAAGLSISLVTVLLSEPVTQTGMVPVGEFLTFENSGTRAYVANAAAQGGQPTGMLRFALPTGSANVSLGAGFTGAQTISVSTGFAATGTLPPGKTQVAFAFQVPYSSTDFVFPYKAEYPTAQIAVLVPMDMQVEVRDFVSQQPVDALGQRYHLLTKDTVATGSTVSLRIWGLPEPGERPNLDFRQLLAVGGGLALLLALLLALFMRRGSLALVLGLVPSAALRSQAAATQGATSGEAVRTRLLTSLLELENAHAAGGMRESEFLQRKAALRAELRAVLARSVSRTRLPDTMGLAPTQESATTDLPSTALDSDADTIAAPHARAGSGGA